MAKVPSSDVVLVGRANPDAPCKTHANQKASLHVYRSGDLAGREHESLMFYIFGIGEDSTTGFRSRLVHPLSRFGLGWTGITALFLVYTAIVTPPTIAFHWLDEECAEVPTLFMDVIVDIFFILDIIINFNTGVILNGEYLDTWKSVAVSYFKGMFVFDVVTSVPVSFFELVSKLECDRAMAAGEGSSSSGSQLRFIRSIKPLRWFKLGKVFRIAKFGHVLTLILDSCNISPRQGKTCKVLTALLLIIHMKACVFWLWKVLGADLEDISIFLDSLPWGRHDSPDISTASGKLQAYIVSVYVITMTLTTVGYGDISAESSSERVGFILLFIVGAFVWGNLLAELSDLHNSGNKRHAEKMERIQHAIDFLMANDCPGHLRIQIVQWLRFHEDHTDENLTKKEMINDMPKRLQTHLIHHLYSKQVFQVPVLAYVESIDKEHPEYHDQHHKFLNNVLVELDYKTYVPDESIVKTSEHPASRLIIFVSGKVRVVFEHPYIDRESMMLESGDFIGDMAILKHTDWAASKLLQQSADEASDKEHHDTEIHVTAVDYVVVLELQQTAFQELLATANVVTIDAVHQFEEKWHEDLKMSIARSAGSLESRVVLGWYAITKRLLKTHAQQDAKEEHAHEWKVAKMNIKHSKKQQLEPGESRTYSDSSNVAALEADILAAIQQLEARAKVREDARELRLMQRIHELETKLSKSMAPRAVSQTGTGVRQVQGVKVQVEGLEVEGPEGYLVGFDNEADQIPFRSPSTSERNEILTRAMNRCLSRQASINHDV